MNYLRYDALLSLIELPKSARRGRHRLLRLGAHLATAWLTVGVACRGTCRFRAQRTGNTFKALAFEARTAGLVASAAKSGRSDLCHQGRTRRQKPHELVPYASHCRISSCAASSHLLRRQGEGGSVRVFHLYSHVSRPPGSPWAGSTGGCIGPKESRHERWPDSRRSATTHLFVAGRAARWTDESGMGD